MRNLVRISILSALVWAPCIVANAGSISAFPPQIQLDSARDPSHLTIMQTRDDGVTTDVTTTVEIAIAPETLARIDARGWVWPVADGNGTITITHGDETLSVPLIVRNAEIDPPMSFRNDIEPAIMRAGCNTGACHGSAQGKNGFMLSLFGFDPPKDYFRLTRESLGRRVNAAHPEQSLMLLKPTGGVDHEGGVRFEEDDPLYQMLRRWIIEGAPEDPADLPALTGIAIYPEEVVLEGADASQQFVVRATYSDGTDRDVTDLAILSSVDDSIVAIDGNGLATAGTRGEAYLMARYGTFAVVSQVITIPEAEVFREPPAAPVNYVDELVYAKHKKLRIQAAERCSDEVFLRRVYLDILGVLPSAEEARGFLADATADKRTRLIDALLARPEFIDLWAMKWAELLRVRSSVTLDKKGMHRYNDWLREAMLSNKPVDALARELLTAEGGNFTSPAANFYMVEREPNLIAENVAQVFMGVQIKCAQCHNHPFDRWTMDDYYSFSAFFAQVARKESSDPRESILYNSGSGEVKNIRDGKVMPPKFLGGEVPDLQGRDRRAVLGDWLTSAENPWFARNVANRVWAHFFGQGIVEPVDDVRVSNPPSNPQLLDELGRRLAGYEYDLRSLIRDICNSNAYQMATQAPAESVQDTRNFAYAQVRRLSSEVLLDAISAVTDTKVKFASLPLGARAIQVADGASGNYFLEAFGRPTRVTACACERADDPTLAQALHLVNGDTISRGLAAPEGRLRASLAAETPSASVVEELYLAAYARAPREPEFARLVGYVDSAEDRAAALEDVYWSVLNSKEFVFNH